MALGKKNCNNKIIGIGGTGMRCVEAFVYMCAVGMFPGKEFQIFLLETDSGNGNFQRTLEVIKNYRLVKGGDGKTHPDGFFSAVILEPQQVNLTYNQNGIGFNNYKEILDAPNLTDDIKRENQTLADLLLDAGVQNYDLLHGYRAKPHLGSFLMYNYFVTKAAENDKKVTELLNSFSLGDKVFLMGSVFGGTGASSIPVLPRALEDAYALLDKGNVNKLSTMVDFGAVLLTNYFEFDVTPGNKNEVVAKANSFLINSQLALKYYDDDTYVNKAFKKFYHLGWPFKNNINYKGDNGLGKSNTGGSSQTNPSHIIELMTVSAANHFFFGKSDPQFGILPIKNDEKSVSHHYIWLKKLENQLNPEFDDITIGNPLELKNKLHLFISLALLVHQIYRPQHSDSNILVGDFRGLIQKMDNAKKFNKPQKFISLVENLNARSNIRETYRINALNEMFGSFFVKSTNDREIIDGWFRQIQASSGYKNFLDCNPDVFGGFDSLQNLSFGAIPKNKEDHITTANAKLLQRLFVEKNSIHVNLFYDKLRELNKNGETPGVEREDGLEFFLHYVYKALAACYGFE